MNSHLTSTSCISLISLMLCFASTLSFCRNVFTVECSGKERFEEEVTQEHTFPRYESAEDDWTPSWVEIFCLCSLSSFSHAFSMCLRESISLVSLHVSQSSSAVAGWQLNTDTKTQPKRIELDKWSKICCILKCFVSLVTFFIHERLMSVRSLRQIYMLLALAHPAWETGWAFKLYDNKTVWDICRCYVIS